MIYSGQMIYSGPQILRISPYSVGMPENEDQNNSKYWHFLRSVSFGVQKTLELCKQWSKCLLLEMAVKRFKFVPYRLIYKKPT